MFLIITVNSVGPNSCYLMRSYFLQGVNKQCTNAKKKVRRWSRQVYILFYCVLIDQHHESPTNMSSETIFDCHLHDYLGTGVEKVLCLQFQCVKQKSREYNQSPMNSTFPCATLGIRSGNKMLAFILQSTEFDFQHQINMS